MASFYRNLILLENKKNKKIFYILSINIESSIKNAMKDVKRSFFYGICLILVS